MTDQERAQALVAEWRACYPCRSGRDAEADLAERIARLLAEERERAAQIAATRAADHERRRSLYRSTEAWQIAAEIREGGA